MTDPSKPRQPRPAQLKPSVWKPRPIPQPAPERRTADPKTPTAKELAARAQQRASLAEIAAPSAATGVSPQPIDCAAAWARYDGEADAVLARGGGDPFERNRAISAGYARVFLSDPARRFR